MPKGKPDAKYVQFTEELNALDYLERAYKAIGSLRRDRRGWKWVVLSLHGALYGFAICAVKGTDRSRVTLPRTKRLIAFDDALKRSQSIEWTRQFTYSRPVELTDDQKDAVRRLKHVRNRFEHYLPLDWSVEEHGLTVSAIDALDVIRALALDTGNVRLNKAQKETVEACVRKGKEILRSSQLYKDHVAALKRQRAKPS